uniref:Secreted protein n=1 Tax=Oryza punctata TaxID=4537 RepID=A0A0E0L9F1_ORYPU
MVVLLLCVRVALLLHHPGIHRTRVKKINGGRERVYKDESIGEANAAGGGRRLLLLLPLMPRIDTSSDPSTAHILTQLSSSI